MVAPSLAGDAKAIGLVGLQFGAALLGSAGCAGLDPQDGRAGWIVTAPVGAPGDVRGG